jgi:nitrite reductase/ring-hydroxylating ferredoxin subunit
MDRDRRITSLDRVPEDTTLLFTVREVDTGEKREAVLVREDDGDGVAGWLNSCQHFTHIPLDKGSGAEMRNGEIVCTNHGAYFEADTGLCTFGPCEGAVLRDVAVTVDDGAVYLTDGEFAFVAVGGTESDDVDLVSESNYEF